MFLNIDNTTRFFTVVGAAYVPEHHFDSHDDNVDRCASRPSAFGVTALPRISAAGSWLQEHD